MLITQTILPWFLQWSGVEVGVIGRIFIAATIVLVSYRYEILILVQL